MKNDLLYKNKKIAVWGLGYIGYSTMAHFAAKGVSCIGYDINENTVKRINEGKLPYDDTMFYWIGFDTKPLVEKGLMRATSDSNDLFANDIVAHLICVPTEKDGEPWDEPLFNVINNIISGLHKDSDSDVVVVVESTISPDKVNDIINAFKINEIDVTDEHSNILLGTAPRRDWFVSSAYNLKTLPRVVGSTTLCGTYNIVRMYEIICDKVLEASGMKEACLVKSVENAYRQLDITFANELALAYPNVNIREVLELAATKWNIILFHPSVGTAGYCINLAPKYVLRGATKPEELKLIKTAIETDRKQSYVVAQAILDSEYKNIGIMGLAYTKNLKVDVQSRTIEIAKFLTENGLNVKVNDPFYSEEEIKQKTGCETFKYPDDLDQFNVLLVIDDHDQYKQVNKAILLEKLRKVKRIIDNVGLWSDMKDLINKEYNSYAGGKIIYSMIGEENWLKIRL